MKKILNEFKTFISKRNALDLAVGVVIGAAFTAILNSFVKDLIAPLIGWALGGVRLDELKIVLRPAVAATDTTLAVAELAITYGMFLSKILDLIVIILALFVFVKVTNTLQKTTQLNIKRLSDLQLRQRKTNEPAPLDDVPAEPQKSE